MQDYKTKDDMRATHIDRANRSLRASKQSLLGALGALAAAVLAAAMLLFLGALISATPSEASTPRFWITPGAVSYHVNRDANYNEANIGTGLEYRVGEDWSVSVGQYKNSIRHQSRYMLIGYTPWHPHENIRIGVLAGTVNGYDKRNGGFLPTAAPVVAVEFGHVGANISFIPPFKDKIAGAFAVQFKFRF